MLLHSYSLVHTCTPVFYMLPMIHKENVPGRPILSGCNSPTANLSIYLDHYLLPILQQIPSYIKNTTHFLRILKEIDGQVPSTSILVTLPPLPVHRLPCTIIDAHPSISRDIIYPVGSFLLLPLVPSTIPSTNDFCMLL